MATATLADLQAQLEAAKADTGEYVDEETGEVIKSDELIALEQAITDAQTTVTNAETELATANANVTTAQQAVTDAETAVTTAFSALDTANQNLADAKAALESAKTAQAEKQSAYDSAKSENESLLAQRTTLTTERDNAQTAVNTASANKKTAEDNVATHTTNVANAKTALDNANTALATAQSNYDNSVTAEANSVIGFYKSLGTEDGAQAAKVYEYYNQKCEEAGYADNCHTQIGVEGDATSLTNVMKSLDYIDECNAYRKAEGQTELKITPMLMAMTEANANRASGQMSHWQLSYLDDSSNEWYRYITGENLSWGYSTDVPSDEDYIVENDPFNGWYTQEKAYYEFGQQWIKVENSATYGEPDKSYKYYNEIVAAIADGKDVVTTAKEVGVYTYSSGGSTGHYRNVVQSSYVTTGFAVSEKDGCRSVHAQKFYYRTYSNDTVYSVSEYRTLLQAYIDKLATYKTALDNAKTDAAAKKSAYETLLNDKSTETALKTAQKALNDANATLTAKTEALTELAAKITTSDTKVSNASDALETAKDNVTTAQGVVDSKATAQQKAQSTYDTASDTLTSKNTTLTSMKNIASKKSTALETANTTLTNKKTAKNTFVQNAEKSVTGLASKIETQEDVVEDASNVLTTAQNLVITRTGELSTAEGVASTAQTKVTSLSSDVEEAKKKQSSANSTVANKQKVYDDLVATNKEIKDATDAVANATTTYENCAKVVNSKSSAVEDKKVALETAKTELSTASDKLDSAKEVLETATTKVDNADITAKEKLDIYTEVKSAYDAIVDAKAMIETKSTDLENAKKLVEEKKVVLLNAQAELEKANEALENATIALEKVSKYVYAGADTVAIDDKEYAYLNDYVDAYRKAVADQKIAMANVEEAKKAYEDAYALVAEGSSLYEKHVAYTTALDAYKAFVKAEEDTKKNTSDSSADTETKQAVETQTIVANYFKSTDTSSVPTFVRSTSRQAAKLVNKEKIEESTATANDISSDQNEDLISTQDTTKKSDKKDVVVVKNEKTPESGKSDMSTIAYPLIGTIAVAGFVVFAIKRRKKEQEQ